MEKVENLSGQISASIAPCVQFSILSDLIWIPQALVCPSTLLPAVLVIFFFKQPYSIPCKHFAFL